MTDVKLKPCPFCGGKAKTDVLGGICYILCPKCGAVISFRRKENKEAAIKAWNRRVGAKDEVESK